MTMSESALQAKREYERKWRAENKERMKAIRARYWEKKAKKEQENENKEAENAETTRTER